MTDTGEYKVKDELKYDFKSGFDGLSAEPQPTSNLHSVPPIVIQPINEEQAGAQPKSEEEYHVKVTANYPYGHHKEIPEIEVFECHLCDNVFSSQQKLSFHMRRHPFSRLFKCNVCNATYGRKDALEKHMEVTKNRRNHVGDMCDICNKVCLSPWLLEEHHSRKHPHVLSKESLLDLKVTKTKMHTSS